jgi:hypothetical protein
LLKVVLNTKIQIQIQKKRLFDEPFWLVKQWVSYLYRQCTYVFLVQWQSRKCTYFIHILVFETYLSKLS